MYDVSYSKSAERYFKKIKDKQLRFAFEANKCGVFKLLVFQIDFNYLRLPIILRILKNRLMKFK